MGIILINEKCYTNSWSSSRYNTKAQRRSRFGRQILGWLYSAIHQYGVYLLHKFTKQSRLDFFCPSKGFTSRMTSFCFFLFFFLNTRTLVCLFTDFVYFTCHWQLLWTYELMMGTRGTDISWSRKLLASINQRHENQMVNTTLSHIFSA